MKKIVIVGGVAGGATLAARLRRLSEEYEIVMLEKDEYIAFANCGLPYYIGGVIEERDKLMVQTVEAMSKRYNLDIRNFSEVLKIDAENKMITVYNHQTKEEYTETYDDLVLSPGATPIVPPFNGLSKADNVFTLRNIPDTDQIKNYLNQHNPKKATVIGGGFIGVEMAENLAHLGIEVTLIDLAEHILKPFDFEMAAKLELNLKNNGVQIMTSKLVKDVRQTEVELDDGTIIPTDVTIMAIGVRPASKLAKDINLDLAENGAIKVDSQFKTSQANIYALGDVISVKNPILNHDTYIPLAWPANRQARLLADILAGQNRHYKGTIGASVLKVNELTAASVGLTEEYLKTTNIKYDSVIVNRGSRAGYYPGGSAMDLKLIFDLNGKILGAQAIGPDMVEKRIDVIATAIKLGATVYDLEDIEVCYAPPFNSAKDPVNIAGYTATNILNGFSKNFKYDELDKISQAEDKLLIDVRTPVEYEIAHVDGAINIEVDELRAKLKEYQDYQDKEVYVYCKVGLRGYTAQKILNGNGFKKVYNLSGGYDIYNTFKKNLAMKAKTNITKEKVEPAMINKTGINTLDARGLQCPGPIMETSKKMAELNDGDKLLIKVTDNGFCEDIKAWCEKCNNQLISIERTENEYEVIIQKNGDEGACNIDTTQNKDNGTIVMFSGDLDKALAAMIISQGAAAMGKQMTVFFTFWGLNVLRKNGPVDVEKTNFEKMFGKMMPQGADKLGLSQMNMAGIGAGMIKKRMDDKNVPNLQEQIKNAQAAGVKFIACTMSMDLMGIKEEELIDGVELGGVAKYIGDSAGADLTLFI